MSKSSPIKILVTGSNGQLGSEFRALAPAHTAFELVFTTKQDLDIRLEHHVKHVVAQHKPQAIINCAAYTNVELAETEREEAMLGNAQSVKHIAEACAEHNVLLLHFSTDYVFDGTKKTAYMEADQAAPLNAYGESKLEGERIVDEVLDRYFLLRASWLYSTYGHNFYKTMLRLAKERGELKVVSDQISSPTYARSLAADVLQLLEKTLVKKEHVEYGLYHYAEHGEASWHQFATEIVKEHNMDIPVHAVLTKDFPTKAVRPAYSKLDNSRFEKLIGREIHSWQEGLKDCVRNEY